MIQIIYDNAPVWLQNLACSIKGFQEQKSRFGGNFNTIYNQLKITEWYSEQEIEENQVSKLVELVKYSYHNVPYYKKIFDTNNIVPTDISNLDDLKIIPVLEKETVRDHYSELVNPNFNEKIIKAHTSGSTGKALHFNFSKEAIRYRWALWFRHRARFGVKPNDPYATFTGLPVVPLTQNKPPFWRENKAGRQTIFTMHHITSDKVPEIIKRLNQGGFKYYAGYPSILYNLALFTEELGLTITCPPQVIFTGAEALLANQRNKISEVFKCLVTDQYGFSEGCGNASRCEFDLFHEDFEYGILECLNPTYNDDGTVTGEILATGFTNLAMPFIRYRVGDTATWINTACKCGRHSKTILNVEGRSEDYVLTPEGNKILRFDYIFKDTVNIKEAQVIQTIPGRITIKIVKRSNYSPKDDNLLKKEVYSKISPSLVVDFEYVDHIERESNGKFRAVRSFLSNNEILKQ